MMSIGKMGMMGLALALACLLCENQTYACTGLKLIAKDGSEVHGRTLEFGVEVETSIAIIPRGYQFTGTTPQGPGLSYKSKYAVVGAIAYDNPAIMDGLNEQGLAMGIFYFPGYAGYTPINAQNQSKALSPVEFGNWILTQFATVDEVRAALPNVIIAPTINKEWGQTPPPFHYIVYDKKGKCVVIEPINGRLVTYENKIGVLTNSPTFDWHMTNLRNYISLSPNNIKPVTVDGVTLAPFGQGSGLWGLPGDFTPPSRFVRAAIFSTAALPSDNATQAIFQGFHILNQFDIPVGAARAKVNGIIHSDYTLITCMRDPQNLRLFFRTYEDQTIRMVDLKKFDPNATKIKMVKTSTKSQPAVDISAELK